MVPPMATIVVTGANRGIGLELTRRRARGNTLIAVCRKPSAELLELGAQIEAGVDVTDDASVSALVARLAGERVDVLINNAGILGHDSFEALDFDAIRAQMEVNAYGPLRVSTAFAPLMAEGGKIAIVTSRMGSIGDNTSGGAYGYRMSKAAVNAAGVSLARDLAPRGIAVALLHPGYVKTEMTGGRGHVSPADAASQLWDRIDELELETSGTFWHANGEVLPW